MEIPNLRRSSLWQLLLDHTLIWFLAQFLDFGPLNVVAKFWPFFCGIVSYAGFKGKSYFTQVLLVTLFTVGLLLCTPGLQSQFSRFWVVWGIIFSLSLVSRKWGLLKIRDMLNMPRHAVDLSIARIIISSLTIFVVVFGKYDHAVIPHNGSNYMAYRDVSMCSVTDQSDLMTGIPIPGMSQWPKLSLGTIHMEEKLLLLASVFSLLGIATKASMLLMFFLQLRVFGQQFFLGRHFFTVADSNHVYIESDNVHTHHTLSLLLWSSLLLIFSPTSDVLSIDAILESQVHTVSSEPVSNTTRGSKYGFPINMSMALLGVGYLVSGLSKAGSGLFFGPNWVNCFVLEEIIERHFVGYSELLSRGLLTRNRMYLYAEHPSLRVLLSNYPILFRFGALATVVWECGFLFLVSSGGFWRLGALLVGVGFHASIYMLTNINFGVFLFNYLVFVPWGMVFESIRSLRPSIEVLHDDSAAHFQMKRILASWNVLNNVRFVHGKHEELEKGCSPKRCCDHRVILPRVSSRVEYNEVLEILSDWICASKSASSQFGHIVILLRTLCWGARSLESLMGRRKRLNQGLVVHDQGSRKQPKVAVAQSVVAILACTSIIWAGFTGEANAWPFASLPKFTAIVFPQKQVLFPDHNFTVSGSLVGYGVSLDGKRHLIDVHWLLRTEPNYKIMKDVFERELGSFRDDNLKLPLECGDGRLQALPPWFMWLISFAKDPSTEGMGSDGRSLEWENSFLAAVKRCWEKDALFLADPDVHHTCEQLRSLQKIEFYRRELRVQSGPPWQVGNWISGEHVYEVSLIAGA